MNAIEASLDVSGMAPNDKLALAEDLLAQAAAGGSRLAIEFMKLRDEPALQADSAGAPR